MKKLKAVLGLAICLTLISSSAIFNSEKFIEVYARNGVKLYERWIEHSSGYQYRELKAEINLNVSGGSFLEFMRNEEKGLAWNINANKYDIDFISEYTWNTYISYDLPWPVSDHDSYLKNKVIDSNGNSIVIQFESDESQPVFESKNRLTNVKGKWVLKEGNTGQSVLEYYVSSKPSSIPKVITDPIVRYNLSETLLRLKSELEKSTSLTSNYK